MLVVDMKSLARLKSERAASGGGSAYSPFRSSVSSLTIWEGNRANFWKNYSPVFIGGLTVFAAVRGLTRKFWAVFDENIFERR